MKMIEMKKNGFLLWACSLCLALTAVTFTACDVDDDNDYHLIRPTALVTVYPAEDSFTMQLDDETVLIPTNKKASPFGEKIVRALVNYIEVNGDQVQGRAATKQHYVQVNWMDSIRTKMPVVANEAFDAEPYGDDPLEIVNDWTTVAEDGFLTLRIHTRWNHGARHDINLISGLNPEAPDELTLLHNAHGDTQGPLSDALVAFNLNQLWPNVTEKKNIKLKWTSFSGEKSTEFSLKMHAN